MRALDSKSALLALTFALALVPNAAAQCAQANRPVSDLTVNLAGSLAQGPLVYNLVSGGVAHLKLTSTVAANAPIVMGVTSFVAPCTSIGLGGSFDLTPFGLEIYSAVYPGFLNSFFRLGTNGEFHFFMAPQVGVVVPIAIQTAVLSPALFGGYALSAAWQFTWQPLNCQPAVVAGLDDDNFVNVALGFNFTFYGVAHNNLNICSNGRIMFGAGSAAFEETEAAFRADDPNICLFWDDLNPAAGFASVRACADPVNRLFVCVFENVPEFFNAGANNGSIVLSGFTNGIGIQYGFCSIMDCIVGISPGLGIDPAGLETNLSTTGAIGAAPGVNKAIFEWFTGFFPFDMSFRQLTFAPLNPAATSYRVTS